MGRGITPGGCQRGGRRGGAFAGEKTRDAVTRRARGDARVFFNRRRKKRDDGGCNKRRTLTLDFI